MAIVVGTGSFLLFISIAVNVVALLVPYWVDTYNWTVFEDSTSGLWGSCRCKWFYTDFDDVKDSGLEAWFKATQWLYASGVALMLVCMVIIFIVSCCSDKSYSKAVTAAGSIMLVAAVLIGVAIVVFGVKGSDERGYGLDGTPRFMWGMWLAVAGCGMAVITSIVFLVQGCRRSDI